MPFVGSWVDGDNTDGGCAGGGVFMRDEVTDLETAGGEVV